ncbi:MAG TPA: CbtA family protein [Pseudonocardiaceae bacterium]
MPSPALPATGRTIPRRLHLIAIPAPGATPVVLPVSTALLWLTGTVLVAILPPLGHLADNVREFGVQSTETPLPLRNAQGTIVYPGFPADILFQFRFYSVAAQLILWTTIALVFAPLAGRLLVPKPAKILEAVPAT